MSGSVLLKVTGAIAAVTLSHPGKLNAMSREMWRKLAQAFKAIQHDQSIRCAVIQGGATDFCAGGDISEYADFRFEKTTLRNFHEDDVWGGLEAMLYCDVPIIARIEGNCMGAGLEIASCCDIRIAESAARFGAPIAKLGFPMAPREAALLVSALGELTVREMLLSAVVLDAAEMKQRGFLNRVVFNTDMDADVSSLTDRICKLAPAAARLNKQTFRTAGPLIQAEVAIKLVADAYDYADSAEHHEGIAAFIEKRPPHFACVTHKSSTLIRP